MGVTRSVRRVSVEVQGGKHMLKTRTLRLAGALVLMALMGVIAATAGASTKAGTVRIWTDHDRLAAVQKVAGAWASSHGVTVQVVEKNFGNIRDDLATVRVSSRPTASCSRSTRARRRWRSSRNTRSARSRTARP